MILLFARLGDLFGSKCKTRGILVYANEHDEEKNIYTDTLKLWYRKLGDLNAENFRTGLAALERKAEDDYRKGYEMWPPSYAEFRALCFPHNDRDTQAHRMAPSLWDPVAMCYRLEDQTAKAKRYEIGRQRTGELLAVIGVQQKAFETPEKTAQANEFARIRLEQAKQQLAKKQGA